VPRREKRSQHQACRSGVVYNPCGGSREHPGNREEHKAKKEHNDETYRVQIVSQGKKRFFCRLHLKKH